MALTRPAIGRLENKVGMQDEIDTIRFAAEQGDAKAQRNLGLMYDQSLGVSQPANGNEAEHGAMLRALVRW